MRRPARGHARREGREAGHGVGDGALPGDHRGADGDRVLRLGARRDGPAELAAEGRGGRPHPGRAPHEQHAVEVRGRAARAREGPRHEVAGHPVVRLRALLVRLGLGRAEDGEPPGPVPQHGGVDAADAELDDGDGGAVGERAPGGVLGRGRLGGGHEADPAQPEGRGDRAERLELGGAPRGGVREHHTLGRAALALGDDVDDPPQQDAEQRARREGGAVEEERVRVGQPGADAAGDAGRLGGGPRHGGVADQRRALGRPQQDRRHRGAVLAEGDDAGPGGAVHGGGGDGGAEVDTELVGHRRLLRRAPAVVMISVLAGSRRWSREDPTRGGVDPPNQGPPPTTRRSTARAS